MTGKELRRLRKTVLHMTQLEMSLDLGVTSTTIANWEHNKPISKAMEQLIRLKYIKEEEEEEKKPTVVYTVATRDGQYDCGHSQFEPIPSKGEAARVRGYPCTICIRVSEHVRGKLDIDSKGLEISVSDVARGILETYYQNKKQ